MGQRIQSDQVVIDQAKRGIENTARQEYNTLISLIDDKVRKPGHVELENVSGVDAILHILPSPLNKLRGLADQSVTGSGYEILSSVSNNFRAYEESYIDLADGSVTGSIVFDTPPSTTDTFWRWLLFTAKSDADDFNLVFGNEVASKPDFGVSMPLVPSGESELSLVRVQNSGGGTWGFSRPDFDDIFVVGKGGGGGSGLGSARILDARGLADGTNTEDCTISSVSGKTRVVLTSFNYNEGLNVGGPKGDLTVLVNGQEIERSVSGVNDETGSIIYEEFDGSTVDIFEVTSIGTDPLPDTTSIMIYKRQVSATTLDAIGVDIFPDTDNAYDIGSDGNRWREINSVTLDTTILKLEDAVSGAPDTVSGVAQVYVDPTSGDLTVKFGDGVAQPLNSHILSTYAAYDTNAGQVIGTSATVVDFEDVISDVNGLVTTGAGWVYTVPSTGLYYINAIVCLNSVNLSPSASQMNIVLNGSTDIARIDLPSATSNLDLSMLLTKTRFFTAGNTIRVTAQCSDVDTINLDTNRIRNYIEIFRLA